MSARSTLKRKRSSARSRKEVGPSRTALQPLSREAVKKALNQVVRYMYDNFEEPLKTPCDPDLLAKAVITG
jgi:hypothetical protein